MFQRKLAVGNNFFRSNYGVVHNVRLFNFIYQNKNIYLKKYTTPSFMLTQSSDVQ